MGINGVPLHPLVVHAAVVFTPLAALAVITFFAMKRWRALLRLPAMVLAGVSGLSIVAAYLSGKNFLSHNPTFRENPLLLQHIHRAPLLLGVGIAFAIVASPAVFLTAVPASSGSTTADRQSVPPAVATAAAVLAVLLAVAVLVLVVVVGDLGARATWRGFKV